jgi:hypothetical protein
MTDDLVKRLRKGIMCGDDPIVEEAADRIEKLETALREIACNGNDDCASAICRIALEEKDE